MLWAIWFPPECCWRLLFALRARRARCWFIPRRKAFSRPRRKSLVAAIAGFGAVAMATPNSMPPPAPRPTNCTRYSRSPRNWARAENWTSSCKHSWCAPRLPGFRPLLRGPAGGRRFHVRWALKRQAEPCGSHISGGSCHPGARVTKKSSGRTTCGSSRREPRGDRKVNVTQLLAVPLLGTDGAGAGNVWRARSPGSGGISPEDIRRAHALATQVAVALEVTRNLHLSEQHRRRAEALMGLALELTQLSPARIRKSFVSRAADMMGASGGGAGVFQNGGSRDSGIARSPMTAGRTDRLERRFEAMPLDQALAQHSERSHLRVQLPNCWARSSPRPGLDRLHLAATTGLIRMTGGRALPCQSRKARSPAKTSNSASDCRPRFGRPGECAPLHPHGAGQPALDRDLRCHHRFHRGPR